MDFDFAGLATGLHAFLRQADVFEAALDSISVLAFRQEGRRYLANHCGLPFGTDKDVAAARRPTSAERGARCSFLDTAVLSEVCNRLRLDEDPWPKAETNRSRADRVLSVIGMLACLQVVPNFSRLDSAATNVIDGILDLLIIVTRRRDVSRSKSPLGRKKSAACWSQPLCAPGDLVFARWALPDLSPSSNVEEAEVLAVDPANGRMRLRYIDGMEIVVPSTWVLQRKRKIRQFGISPIPSQPMPEHIAAGFSSSDDEDYPPMMLLQCGRSPAEICARVRTLCSRPRCSGLEPLVAAVRASLPRASEQGRHACIEALCSFCVAGLQDVEYARALANAVLLSDCGPIPCTPQQIYILRHALSLSETQRSKLLALVRPACWRPAPHCT
jgi:hypothetical protein